MKRLPASSVNTSLEQESQRPAYLTARPRQEKSILQWWYRLSSPAEPEHSVSLEQENLFRRGRVGSQLILTLYLLLITSIPAQFVGTNIYLVPIVIGASVALLVATVLNRLEQVTLAGVIVVLTFIAFPVVNIVTTPGGLSVLVLPLYGLLVLPLLCAVSFLPPWWVFVVAVGNCGFTLFSLTYLLRTAELKTVLSLAFAGIVVPIILVQLLVSVVAYVWVRGTTQALIRADLAEEIARLEHDLGQQAKFSAQQKQQLEASIQQIVETHVRVANGDYSARVPLTQENVLWQISGSLNNLLVRFQRLRHVEDQYERMKLLLQQAHEEISRLQRSQGKSLN